MSIRRLALIGMGLFAIVRLNGYFTEPHLPGAEIHRIVGEPRRIESSAPAPLALKVVSWNIERGSRFEQVASTLGSFGADVVLLQEVDRFCGRSDDRDVASELAVRLGMNWVAAGEFQEIGEGRRGRAAITGQAILSRYAIDSPRVIVFNTQSWFRWHFSPTQPRRGARIALTARTAGTLLYNLHVESGGNDTLRQRQLADVLADAAREPGDPAMIVGDFNNSDGGRAALLSTLARANFTDAVGLAADQSTHIHHRYPIDWIFTRGIESAGGGVERTGDTSDHYPVVATLVVRN
jgi:endonuclease/exonuclease/phosphatase family metal-dependent hydrolase